MDYRDSSHRKQFNSILEGADEFCLNNKILARESSAGQSSRIYYSSNKEGVPFKWEMQPGTPKSPPREEMIPPPTPPPAMLSLGLPQPNLKHHTKESRRWTFWLWKRSKKRQEVLRGNYKRSVSSDNEFEVFHEFGDSDGEFTTTSVHDSRSSSASSSSSNGTHLRAEPRFPLFCTPWQH